VAAKCKSLTTRPRLECILSDALKGWFQHSLVAYAYELNPSAYPKDVRRLIRQQNKIGWRQLFWEDSVANGVSSKTIITRPEGSRNSRRGTNKEKDQETDRSMVAGHNYWDILSQGGGCYM
jgi:hypothetical protein